jgi:PAS domain S-box-containing protein
MAEVKKKQRESGSPNLSLPGKDTHNKVSLRLEQFEKRQKELWNLTFLVLIVLAVVFAAVSWDTIRSLSKQYQALPIGLVVLVALFTAYIWKKSQEISELRGLIRGIEERAATPPSEKQFDQLFQVISRSQQGFRDLIDSFDDVLIAFTLDGEIRAVNRSFAELVDAPFQQLIGKQLGDFVEETSGEGPEMFRRALPRFLERRNWAGIVQIRIKSQKPIYYFDCAAQAMIRDDKVIGITILARDVTAQRKNEARFTELFETLQEGIYITTPEGNILDANPAMVRMFGYASRADLLSVDAKDLYFNPADRAVSAQLLDSQDSVVQREVTLRRKDGSPIICFNTATAIRDAAGRILRYQGALMDITAHREMERQLHRQQEFARRLIDSFPDLILVLDTTRHFTFVSPRVKDVLGFGPHEIPNQEFSEHTHPDDRPALLSMFEEIVSGRQTLSSLEARVRNKQGDWRRIRLNFSPLFDEVGKIDGVVLSGRDVTDLKRLEEQLIQAEKLAAMGQMLAGVAHELNNPLTAILGVTELLGDREGLDESVKRQLDLTHRQARRAARIVQNLLDFSRPAAPQKKLLDVCGIVERTLQLHEHSLRANHIEVDFIPLADPPGVVGDANQLMQIFLNLLTNAEYAIHEVRDSGRVRIRISRHDSRIAITFQDDGVGISPEALPRIFDPFYTTKRPGGGTGLGLSICMSIVREHGGVIEAGSLPAGGSAFTVYLPIVSESISTQADQPERLPFPESLPPSPVSSKPRAILVLDDEVSVRALLEEGLSSHGLRVDCAATTDEALNLLREHSYDVLLCDLNLSPLESTASGQSAAQRILAAAGDRKPSVVFMTGDLVEQADIAPKPGEPRTLQKPFRIADVLATIDDLLSPLNVPNLQD